MINFKDYLTIREGKADEDVGRTLGKIPSAHRELVRGYKIVFQPGNGLKGDPKHVGLIDEKEKTITLAAPWNHSREYTLLHEVGHAVWKYVLDEEMKKKWAKMVESKKGKGQHLNQGAEETFCMLYAQYYAKNKLLKYDHPELLEFMKKL